MVFASSFNIVCSDHSRVFFVGPRVVINSSSRSTSLYAQLPIYLNLGRAVSVQSANFTARRCCTRLLASFCL